MKDDVKSILIIDDEAAIRQSFSDFLEDMGYRILTAENGRAGLETFRKENPDLILVDLRMPEIDGLDVLAQVAEEDPDLPIIVVSGTGIVDDTIEALRRGAWDYLLKPITDLSMLNHAVKNALEKSQLIHEVHQYRDDLERKVRERTEELNRKTAVLKEEIGLRKETEEKLRSLLYEKDILLQEVHHRVRNNMAIIISLLNLKCGNLSNSEAGVILEDTVQRIKSMSLVHEILYSNDNFENVNVKDYLYDLVNDIMCSYSLIPGEIELSFTVEDILLGLDKLIPLGLITNEIVTNSIKHAFTDTAAPRISLGLKKTADGRGVLTASDNGRGLQEEKGAAGQGKIGLELIDTLVRQMGGQVDVSAESGTRYTISFPINDSAESGI